MFSDFFFNDGLEAEMESSSSTLARLLAAVDRTSVVDMPPAGMYMFSAKYIYSSQRKYKK
jgi:hypothetical protein